MLFCVSMVPADGVIQTMTRTMKVGEYDRGFVPLLILLRHALRRLFQTADEGLASASEKTRQIQEAESSTESESQEQAGRS